MPPALRTGSACHASVVPVSESEPHGVRRSGNEQASVRRAQDTVCRARSCGQLQRAPPAHRPPVGAVRFKAALVDAARYLMGCYRHRTQSGLRRHGHRPGGLSLIEPQPQRQRPGESTDHAASGVPAPGINTRHAAGCLSRPDLRAPGRTAARRAVPAHPAAARLGQRSLPPTDRNADPASGGSHASRQAMQAAHHPWKMNLTLFVAPSATSPRGCVRGSCSTPAAAYCSAY